MLKLFRQSFSITNDCMIIITPLIVFLSLIGIYVNYALSIVDNTSEIIFAAVTIFVVTSGFMSSWLYMVKKALQLTKQVFVFDNERLRAVLGLFKCLLTGIGKLLIPVIWILSFYIVLYLLIMSLLSFLITKFLIPYPLWNALWIFLIVAVTFLTLLWLPEVLYNKVNAYLALFNSIKKLFKNFKSSVILYIWIALILSAIFVINTKLGQHPILAFATLMIFYYLLAYVVVLLFTCYEQIYNKE